jgi:hypothetical protein
MRHASTKARRMADVGRRDAGNGDASGLGRSRPPSASSTTTATTTTTGVATAAMAAVSDEMHQRRTKTGDEDGNNDG